MKLLKHLKISRHPTLLQKGHDIVKFLSYYTRENFEIKNWCKVRLDMMKTLIRQRIKEHNHVRLLWGILGFTSKSAPDIVKFPNRPISDKKSTGHQFDMTEWSQYSNIAQDLKVTWCGRLICENGQLLTGTIQPLQLHLPLNSLSIDGASEVFILSREMEPWLVAQQFCRMYK